MKEQLENQFERFEKNYYVEKVLTKEGKNRSKYIVAPTFKGVYYGLAYLGIQIDKVLKTMVMKTRRNYFLSTFRKLRIIQK